MNNFKRIILTDKAPITIYDNNIPLNHIGQCVNVLTKAENVQKVLKQLQDKGYKGTFIVIDEQQFSSGNGVITKDMIVGGAA